MDICVNITKSEIIMIDSAHIASRKKPSLKNLFPNGEESYLAITVKLYEQDIVHIVICNDRLAENGNIWKKTAELVADTELELTLATIKKEDFRVLRAADILNSQGSESITCVKTQADYMNVMNGLIKEYNDIMETAKNLAESGVLPKELLPVGDGMEDVGNTGIGTYTPQTEEEIEFMYQ